MVISDYETDDVCSVRRVDEIGRGEGEGRKGGPLGIYTSVTKSLH